jgi:hypothetical protein
MRATMNVGVVPRGSGQIEIEYSCSLAEDTLHALPTPTFGIEPAPPAVERLFRLAR